MNIFLDDEIFVDDSRTQRDAVSANYQAAASNAQAIGAMLTKIPRCVDYDTAVELSAKANKAMQKFHDAIGCLLLEIEIADRERKNAEARELLREKRPKLRRKKK